METSINIKKIPVKYVEELDKLATYLSSRRGQKVSRNDLLIEIIAYELSRKNLVRIEEKFEDNTKKIELALSTLVDKIEEMNNSSTILINALLESSTDIQQ